MKKTLLIFGLIFLLVGGIFYWLIGSSKSYQSVTAEEMYESLVEFYSIVFNGYNVREGEFKQWPRGGERVSLTESLEGYFVGEEIFRHHREWVDHYTIKIGDKNETVLSGTLASTWKSIRVLAYENGQLIEKEISVPFSLSFRQNISPAMVDTLREGVTRKVYLHEYDENGRLIGIGERWGKVNLKGVIKEIHLPPGIKLSLEGAHSSQRTFIVLSAEEINALKHYGITIHIKVHKIERIKVN